jgi:hypothetical protein
MPTEITENTSGLPYYVRFRDLRAANIVDNWQQLFRLINDYGFPCGTLLSPNVRAWDREEVRKWLDARPVERKIIAPRRARFGNAVTAELETT